MRHERSRCAIRKAHTASAGQMTISLPENRNIIGTLTQQDPGRMAGTLLDMASSAPVGRVRVLTHNILGRQAGWENRRPVLIDSLRALAPDLVAFQESVI